MWWSTIILSVLSATLIGGLILLLLSPDLLAAAVNHLIAYVISTRPPGFIAKRVTVKSIDVLKKEVHGIDFCGRDDEVLSIKLIKIECEVRRIIFGDFERKSPISIKVSGVSAKFTRKSFAGRQGKPGNAETVKGHGAKPKSPGGRLAALFAAICFRVEDVHVVVRADSMDSADHVSFSLKCISWQHGADDELAGICANALSVVGCNILTEDPGFSPLVLPSCSANISFRTANQGGIVLESVGIAFPKNISVMINQHVLKMLPQSPPKKMGKKTSVGTKTPAITLRAGSVDVRSVEFLLVGGSDSSRGANRTLLRIESMFKSAFTIVPEGHTPEQRRLELNVIEFKIESPSSLELVVDNASVVLSDGNSTEAAVEVERLNFKDVRQYANSTYYSNIRIEDLTAKLEGPTLPEIQGESSEIACKFRANAKDCQVVIFPALVETLISDALLLKRLFAFRESTVAVPPGGAVGGADEGKRDARKRRKTILCDTNIEFLQFLLKYYVAKDTGFSGEADRLVISSAKTTRGEVKVHALPIFHLSAFQHTKHFDLAKLGGLIVTFEPSVTHEPSGKVGMFGKVSVDSAHAYVDNRVPLGNLISIFLLQLKGIKARVFSLLSIKIKRKKSVLSEDEALAATLSHKGKWFKIVVKHLSLRFEDEETQLPNEYQDESDKIDSQTKKRKALFNIDATNIGIDVSTHDYPRHVAIQKLISWDSCTDPPVEHGFVDVYAGDACIDIGAIDITVRNFYHSLFRADKLRVRGGVVLAVLNSTPWCTWKRDVMLAGSTDYKVFEIVTASTPMKPYFDLTAHSEFATAAWGPCLNFALNAWSRTLGRCLPKSIDPSAPMKFWDLYRYMFHGPFRFSSAVFHYIAYGPGVNSHIDDYACLVLEDLDCFLHKQGRVECKSAKGSIQRKKIVPSSAAADVGQCLVEMKSLALAIGYVWHVPDAEGFDHYVQLHEHRVKVLRKGKQLRDVFAAFRAKGMEIDIFLGAESATAVVEWHRHISWFTDVYNSFMDPLEAYWTTPPRTIPTIGYIMSSYSFDMKLGNVFLAIDDDSIGEKQDAIITSDVLRVFYSARYKMSSFEPGEMNQVYVDLTGAHLYFTPTGVRRIDAITDPPVFDSKSLYWTLNHNENIANITTIRSGRLRWTVDARDLVVDLINLLWTSPGDIDDDAGLEKVTEEHHLNNGGTQGDSRNSTGLAESHSESGADADPTSPILEKVSVSSSEDAGLALGEEKRLEVSQSTPLTNRMLHQRTLSTEPEHDEMSLLNLLTKRQFQEESDSPSALSIETRRTREDSYDTSEPNTPRSVHREFGGPRPSNLHRRRKSSESAGPSPVARKSRAGSKVAAKWWEDIDFTYDYKVMVFELQVYFLSTITHSGMLLSTPSVEVAGRHKFEDGVSSLMGKERMDELYVETSNVEIYVAPGDVEMRRDPWLGQNQESPSQSSPDPLSGKSKETPIEKKASYTIEGDLLGALAPNAVSSEDQNIYRLALSSPKIQLANQSFTNYAPWVRLRIETIKAKTISPEFYQILDVVRNVLLAPPKAANSSGGDKTSSANAEVNEEKDAATDALSVDEVEDILENQQSANGESNLLSVLSYELEGLVWTLQSMNDGPPIDLGIRGVHGEHLFYEDTSTEVKIDVSNLCIVDMKPGALAAIHFEDSSMVLRSVLEDRKQSTENLIEVRAHISPQIDVRNNEVSIYDRIEIVLFPGTNYFLSVQLTDTVAKALSQFFFGEEATNAVFEEETELCAEEILLGTLVSREEDSEEDQSEGNSDDENEADDEEDAQGTKDQFVYFKRARVGEIQVKVSAQGFAKGLNLNAWRLKVSPFSKSAALLTWQNFLKELQWHVINSLLKSAGKNLFIGTSGKSKIVDTEDEAGLLLGQNL
jgi:hypothetical protein